MKKYAEAINIKATLALVFIILALSFSLFGCGGDKPIVKDKIEVENSEIPPHSEETKLYAKEVIFSLLSGIEEAEKKSALTESEKQKLLKDTERLFTVSQEILIPERDYLSYFELIEKNESELISALTNLTSGSLDTLFGIYLELSDSAGSDYVGRVFYGVCLYLYDSKYEKQITLYESYGDDKDKYKYLLMTAEGIKADKTVFEREIGAKNSVEFIKFSFFARELFLGGAFTDERMKSFTNEEILVFLKHLDFSGISIGKDGYKLISKYYSKLLIAKKETTYFDEILYKAYYNNDIDKFADSADELISLLSSVKDSLKADDIGLLREGETEKFISNIFSRFTENDRALFEEISAVSVSRDYDSIATEFFGDAYTTYKTSLVGADIDALRAAVGKDYFYTTLEAYIFGISPAFAYPLFRGETV